MHFVVAVWATLKRSETHGIGLDLEEVLVEAVLVVPTELLHHTDVVTPIEGTNQRTLGRAVLELCDVRKCLVVNFDHSAQIEMGLRKLLLNRKG